MIPQLAEGQQGEVTALADSTKFHYWYSVADARSTALANSTIADPGNEYGLYLNPALIALHAGETRVSINSTYYSTKKIAVENMLVPINISPNQILVVGGMFHHSVSGRSPLLQNNQLAFSQYRLDIAYAQSVIENLSMGFQIQSSYGYTETGSAWSGDARLGFLYAPSPLVSYGIVYKGTGYQNSWLGSGIVYRKAEYENQTEIGTVRLPQRVELGASLRFPSLSKYPNFVLSFSNEKIFGVDGLIYRGGLEVYIGNLLILRGGYFHSPNVQGGRVGFGLLMSPFRLSYSYAPNNLDLSGRAHQIGVSLNW